MPCGMNKRWRISLCNVCQLWWVWLLPFCMSGSLIGSIVLDLPTVEPLLFTGRICQDMFLAVSFLMWLAVLAVLGVFLLDLFLLWLDPWIRFEAKSEV